MNRNAIFRSGLLVAAIVAVVTAAHASPSRTFSIDQPTLLDGRSIPPGSYVLGWEMKGGPDDLQVTIRSGKRLVGRAEGRQVQLDAPSPYDAVIYAPGTGGVMHLVEIRFASSKSAIRIDAREFASDEQGPVNLSRANRPSTVITTEVVSVSADASRASL